MLWYKKNSLIKNLFEDIKKRKENYNLGNGGSAAIANHVCVDIVKLTKIRTLNFNNSSLFTCFANDYGHDRWMEQGLIHFGDEGDLLIAISSSGKSKNILNACRAAKRKRFKSIITLTGFNHDNKIRKLEIWIFGLIQVYNFIENIHQIILLSTVDLFNKTHID